MARQDFAQKRRQGSSASRPQPSRPAPASKKRKSAKPWPRIILTLAALGGLLTLLWSLLQTDRPDKPVVETPKRVEPRQTEPRQVAPAPAQRPAPAPAPSPTQPATTDTRLPAVVEKSMPAPQPSLAVAPPPAPVEPETPDVPESRFDFYNILPRNEIQAPQNVYHSTPKAPSVAALPPATQNTSQPPSTQATTQANTAVSPANPNLSPPTPAPSATTASSSRYLLQAGSFRSEEDAERLRVQLLLTGLPNAHLARINTDSGIWYRVRTGPFQNDRELSQARSQLNALGITPFVIPQN